MGKLALRRMSMSAAVVAPGSGSAVVVLWTPLGFGELGEAFSY